MIHLVFSEPHTASILQNYLRCHPSPFLCGKQRAERLCPQLDSQGSRRTPKAKQTQPRVLLLWLSGQPPTYTCKQKAKKVIFPLKNLNTIEDNRKPSTSGYLMSTKDKDRGDWCHSMHAHADPQSNLCLVDSHQVHWILPISRSCLPSQRLIPPPDVNHSPGP